MKEQKRLLLLLLHCLLLQDVTSSFIPSLSLNNHDAFPLDPTSPSRSRYSYSQQRTNLPMVGSGRNQDETTSKRNIFNKKGGEKGRILILGGSGFLGENIACRAIREGYAVTSISRRGRKPRKGSDDSSSSSSSPSSSDEDLCCDRIDYRIGDARDLQTIENVLLEENSNGEKIVAVIHCIGLLFDAESRLGTLNRFVSGSGSRPGDPSSTYDEISRVTAFHAITATESYAKKYGQEERIPFIFTSAAEAGWPEVRGGKLVERVSPRWLRRYLAAKRAVEGRLCDKDVVDCMRPVIFRPSLIYSLDKFLSLAPVGAFYVGNRLGLPFVDRPVTVQALSTAVLRAIGNPDVEGVQRFREIDDLSR